MKKGFTLVELLVVVAILGILAAVGIVSFGGFLSSAKEKATVANHKNIVNFMNLKFTQCSIQEKISLLDHEGEAQDILCNELDDNEFVTHFISAGFKNPYGKTGPDDAVYNGRYYCGDMLGGVGINYNKDGYTISTYYKEGVDCIRDRMVPPYAYNFR